ncbi:MAG: ABC transporter substrate-binding protein, partial [Chloroflexi bacterium]|nr:ABC transporter substrate-binding protein [Chloroflexota bacterium]
MMIVSIRYLSLLAILAIALVACGASPAAQPPTAAPVPTAAPTAAPTVAVLDEPVANLTEGCVTNYDAEIDYFPEKVSLSDSVGWTIEYFNNYKVITVLNPWRDAEEQFRYVLVQCGTPPPADVGEAQVIEVPVQSIVTMSTTQLPHLNTLGLLDRLVGVASFQYINTPAVIELIKANKLVEIG